MASIYGSNVSVAWNNIAKRRQLGLGPEPEGPVYFANNDPITFTNVSPGTIWFDSSTKYFDAKSLTVGSGDSISFNTSPITVSLA